MVNKVRYGIGEQDFMSLRERNCVYVDKTEYIEKIIESGSKYYFLARPRRFGKSLLLSTIRYFFEGRRELFKGLYIDSIDYEWPVHPVLYIDLNPERYAQRNLLDNILDNLFSEWEKRYNVQQKASDLSVRFRNIVKAAHEKTGYKVIILVDEYDKPLVSNLDNSEIFDHYRLRLASVYSNFKSSSEHIRLVFLTGVSRFSRLSVFSDLNNINDITFDSDFADICGITEKELTVYFRHGIQTLADKNGNGFTETLTALRKNYDGYRFADEGSDIYNPWSVLNCLEKKRIYDYWNETGTPTILAKALKRIHADLEKTLDVSCTEADLRGMHLLNPNPTPLMYQTGYLTIKEYVRETNEYRLGIPNNEVRRGFFNYLLPYYVECGNRSAKSVVADILRSFMAGDPDEAMKSM